MIQPEYNIETHTLYYKFSHKPMAGELRSLHKEPFTVILLNGLDAKWT